MTAHYFPGYTLLLRYTMLTLMSSSSMRISLIHHPLLQLGRLRTGTKSDLLHCLQDAISVNSDLLCPTVQVSILDGTAIVKMLQPGTAKTFNDHATTVFIPYIISQLQNTVRLDI